MANTQPLPICELCCEAMRFFTTLEKHDLRPRQTRVFICAKCNKILIVGLHPGVQSDHPPF